MALTGFAALPFAFSGLGLSYTDAFFEAMSGLTTTGATIITDLDTPPGILLWRALLQWFGGIGIIVMAISVLPMLNVGGMQLFRLESSDTSEKILPRTAQIAGSITRLYFAITLACVDRLYALAGMDIFDAVAHAMTTIATGGFSTRDDSLGAFAPSVAMVAVIFMLLSPCRLSPICNWSIASSTNSVQDAQIRTFLILALVACLAMWGYQLNIGIAAPAERAFGCRLQHHLHFDRHRLCDHRLRQLGAVCAGLVFCPDLYRRLRRLDRLRAEDFSPASHLQSGLALYPPIDPAQWGFRHAL